MARLGDIRPGAAIDRLKEDINHLVRENVQIKNHLNGLDHFLLLRKSQIADFDLRQELAAEDKTELFRDNATFEINFSRRDKKIMYKSIDNMTENIGGTLATLNELVNSKKDIEKTGFTWLNKEQDAEVFDMSKKLWKLKEQESLRRLNNK